MFTKTSGIASIEHQHPRVRIWCLVVAGAPENRFARESVNIESKDYFASKVGADNIVSWDPQTLG